MAIFYPNSWLSQFFDMYVLIICFIFMFRRSCQKRGCHENRENTSNDNEILPIFLSMVICCRKRGGHEYREMFFSWIQWIVELLGRKFVKRRWNIVNLPPWWGPNILKNYVNLTLKRQIWKYIFDWFFFLVPIVQIPQNW